MKLKARIESCRRTSQSHNALLRPHPSCASDAAGGPAPAGSQGLFIVQWFGIGPPILKRVLYFGAISDRAKVDYLTLNFPCLVS
jgi:hypothetical protein